MNPENPSPSSPSGGAFAETKAKIAQSARETVSKVKSAASDAATQVKEEGGRIASEKKQAVASRIGDYGSAIHETAASLEEKDPNIAWLTHQAADRLQHVADYVRNRNFTGLRADVEGIGRRHPAAFVGGLFVAGLILGNMAKASGGGPRESGQSGDEGHDTFGSRSGSDKEGDDVETSGGEIGGDG